MFALSTWAEAMPAASASVIAAVINFFIFILQSGASRLLTRACARKT
jgi:hypothetical protein